MQLQWGVCGVVVQQLCGFRACCAAASYLPPTACTGCSPAPDWCSRREPAIAVSEGTAAHSDAALPRTCFWREMDGIGPSDPSGGRAGPPPTVRGKIFAGILAAHRRHHRLRPSWTVEGAPIRTWDVGSLECGRRVRALRISARAISAQEIEPLRCHPLWPAVAMPHFGALGRVIGGSLWMWDAKVADFPGDGVEISPPKSPGRRLVATPTVVGGVTPAGGSVPPWSVGQGSGGRRVGGL